MRRKLKCVFMLYMCVCACELLAEHIHTSSSLYVSIHFHQGEARYWHGIFTWQVCELSCVSVCAVDKETYESYDISESLLLLLHHPLSSYLPSSSGPHAGYITESETLFKYGSWLRKTSPDIDAAIQSPPPRCAHLPH